MKDDHKAGRDGTAKRMLWLFGVNLYISAFTFGGGYVVLPMVRKAFVEKKGLFSEEELLDMAAIAQSSPGAIAVNLAVLAGYRTAGMPGAMLSCVAAVLPPLGILAAVAACYAAFRANRVIAAVLKGMEAGVAALVADVVVDMSRAVFRQKDPLTIAIVPLTFIACTLLQAPVLPVLAAGAGICFMRGWVQGGKRR